MKKIFVIIVFIVLFFNNIEAQQSIKTLPEYKKTANFVFTNEWQYLSTDLYLFNAEKFNKLITDIATNLNSTRPRRDPEIIIDYLFITANIKDVKFFGGDLTYPIYNFQVQKSTASYQTITGNSAEVIRIIDKLPLSATNDFIQAEIKGEAITHNNMDQVNSIIATQLMNISTITNPSAAVLSLVGEFGKFLKSKTEGKKYEFSSTIRLYDGQNFDERLHSINIYVFTPTSVQQTNLNATALTNYLDSAKFPVIDRRALSGMIQFQDYPYIVVANYKSRYLIEPIVGDEIDFETIETRKQKNRYAFDNALISRDIFFQETKLIEFLEIFAKLKLEINTYRLNYQNAITEDFSKNLFIILQNYRLLKTTFESRKMEFANNAVFNNEFKRAYEDILINSELYLEADNNLRTIKELVNTVHLFTVNQSMRLDSAQRETYLRKLNSVSLPETVLQTNEAKEIKQLTDKLEDQQYAAVYQHRVNQLTTMQANDETINFRNDLVNRVKNTSCQLCREKVEIALAAYNTRYEEFKKRSLKETTEELLKNANNELFNALQKEECINKNFTTLYGENIPAHILLLKTNYEALIRKRIELQQLVNSEYNQFTYDELQKFNNQLIDLYTKLSSGYADICSKVPELCNCK